MRKYALLFWAIATVSAQVSFTGNTETRIGESSNGFYYNETLINTNLQYGAFTNWIQLEYSDPPELGRRINGVRKLRLEYENGPVTLKLGDLYEIWGRGLVLNSVDDQPIDHDTGIRGISLKYSINPLNIHFITGSSDIQLSTPTNPDPQKHDYTALHNIYGLDGNYSLGNQTFGSSFIQSKEKHAVNLFISFPDTVNIKNQIMSFKYSFNHPSFDIYTEYVKNQSFQYDETNELFNNYANGRGLYGNINVYLNFLSLNIEYINYRFGTLDPDNRGNFVDNYGLFQPYQNPPIAINIHENILMNRVSHQINMNNEVGYKIELMGMINNWIDILAIYSASSQSHSWFMDSNYQWKKEGEAALFPHSDKKAATPFQEFYGELSFYMIDQKLHLKAGYSNSYDVTKLFLNTKTDTSSSMYYDLQKSIAIPLNISYTFESGWSINARVETQFYTKGVRQVGTLNGSTVVDTFMSTFYNDKNNNEIPEKNEYLDYETNNFISLSISKSPLWSLAFTLDKTNVSEVINRGNEFENTLEKLFNIDQSRNWVNVEFVYNISSTIRLSLLYGSLKGGLVCTNGICRIIEPFNDGFKMRLTSMF